MTSDIPIGYIDIKVFIHATEAEEKVLDAVFNILPASIRDLVVFKRASFAGQYKNPITLFQTRIQGSSVTQAVFQKLSLELNTLDKQNLGNNIERHIEKGNLYLRFDKQAAYRHELRLLFADPIHFRIHFKRLKSKEVVQICQNAGLIS